MPQIHLVIFGLAAVVPEWRRTCFIIFLAALANILYQPITAAASINLSYNVPAVYVAQDFITIMALLIWGKKGSLLQASVLTVAIATNLALLLDYKAPPYPVYEHYKEVIFALNVTQIILIGGGIYAVVHRLRDELNNLLGGIRHSGFGSRSARSGHHQHRDSNQ